MKHKITLEYWDHTCGDGCCYDYGTALYVNGKLISRYFEHNAPEQLKDLFAELGVDVEIEEKDDYEKKL